MGRHTLPYPPRACLEESLPYSVPTGWTHELPRTPCSSNICQKVWIQPAYRVGRPESRVRDIMEEIYINGPVIAVMRISPDFYMYNSGVYQVRGGR